MLIDRENPPIPPKTTSTPLEDAQRLVTTYISTSATQIPTELLQFLEEDQIGLLTLVKALGEYLTSTDDGVRARAVGLLTGVLAKISTSKVNRQSTRVLTSFYCDKLDDIYVLAPVLQGLCVLSALPTFGTGETSQVCQAIFDNIKMKASVQSVRFLVFKIIDILMANHRDALKKLGENFIQSYCRLADGEKDPRNLLIAFSIGRVIVVEFDIESSMEDLFDCTFCYFPITYKPPPNDPYNISTEDLRIALRSCLAGTPLFAKQAMQLLLDKLAASGGEMKKDTLRTIAACLPVYGLDNAVEFSSEIWEALKVEALFTSDAEIEAETLLAIESFLATLYPTVDHKPTGIATTIVEQCLELLKEPEKSKAKPATKILTAAFKSSPSVGPFAYAQAFPQLFQLYRKTEDFSQRGPILEVLTQLIQAARELYAIPAPADGATSWRSLQVDGVFEQFRDDLLGCLTSGIQTSNFRKPALEAYMQLVQIEGYLSSSELGFVVQSVNELILSEEADHLRGPALAGLAIISKIAPKTIEEITLPLLFSKLPDSPPPLEGEEDRVRYRRILSSLSVLCVQPPLFEILVVRITSKLDLLCSSTDHLLDPASPSTPRHGTQGVEDLSMVDKPSRECDAVYAFALLSCLLNVLRTKVDAGHLDIPKYIDQLVPRLFTIFVLAALSTRSEQEIAADPRLVVVASRIIETVVQTLSVERQTKFAKSLFGAYREGRVRELMHQPPRSSTAPSFLPFGPNASEPQKNLIILFSAAVTALRPQVELIEEDLSSFLSSILQWTLDSAASPSQVKSAFHVFASLVNKRTDTITPFLADAAPALWTNEVMNKNSTVSRRNRAIRAWVWLCRALLVRNHDLGFQFLGQLFTVFSEEEDESLAREVALALTIIAEGDGAGILSKRNHSVLRLLHKQKFFNFVLPKIIAGYSASQGSPRQTVYLVALASIIKVIPRALCVAELPTLLPLLLRCIDLPDAELKANVMDVLLVVAEADDPVSLETVEAQAPRIVEGLLRGLDKTKGSNERSRSAALRTLAVFPDVVRYDVLHPIKAQVIKELGKALDDKKRNVRKEAVDCRARWFLYHG
ncbi:Dos2-interacting transcription regulator of RNA-Pol-II-domain-containing protein [Mrakia frigida]|uniref:Met18p n=1 Tax=Mrakia frigida TaxID=29902 RepID=UPI003FCC1E02